MSNIPNFPFKYCNYPSLTFTLSSFIFLSFTNRSIDILFIFFYQDKQQIIHIYDFRLSVTWSQRQTWLWGQITSTDQRWYVQVTLLHLTTDQSPVHPFTHATFTHTQKYQWFSDKPFIRCNSHFVCSAHTEAGAFERSMKCVQICSKWIN